MAYSTNRYEIDGKIKHMSRRNGSITMLQSHQNGLVISHIISIDVI